MMANARKVRIVMGGLYHESAWSAVPRPRMTLTVIEYTRADDRKQKLGHADKSGNCESSGSNPKKTRNTRPSRCYPRDPDFDLVDSRWAQRANTRVVKTMPSGVSPAGMYPTIDRDATSITATFACLLYDNRA